MRNTKAQTKRKSIGQKTRFEVFKRDSFKCQYCGESSPEVVLHVDHIKPVSKGGDNTITNLITACQGCNSGKSDVELDDQSALIKQKAQMDELNERREQLQMMMDWRSELKEMDADSLVSLIADIEEEIPGRKVNDNGKQDVRKWLKKYTYTLLTECIDISSSTYLKLDDEGSASDESVQKFFSMIPRIAANKTKFGDDPDIARLYYARGILRNRLSYCNDALAIDLLTQANKVVSDPEQLISIAKEVKNWSNFRTAMEAIVQGEE